MKTLAAFAFAFTFVANTLAMAQDAAMLVIVVNKNSSVNALTKSEVIDIYMGRYLTFPSGAPVRPLDFAPKSNFKARFYKKLVNQSEAKVNAYWARLLFSGRATPPEIISTMENMITMLRSSTDTLGYLPLSEVDNTMKVVFRFERLQP